MSIRRALSVTLIAMLVLAILVYGVLFQAYGTNDDVAIRLILEGQFYPGKGPVPWMIFVNLSLSQALVSLHRMSPGVAWYDLYEQGLLWSSLGLLIYSVCRGMKTWSAPGVVAFSIGAALCTLLEVQFTTVAVLATLAGVLGVTGLGRGAQRDRLETLGLTLLGALLLVAAAALRFEAMALTMICLATSGAWVWIMRHRSIRPGRIAVPILGLAVAALVFQVLVSNVAWPRSWWWRRMQARWPCWSIRMKPPPI